jgi:hypothetical protein
MRDLVTLARLALLDSVKHKLFSGLMVFLAVYIVFVLYISTLSLGTAARYIAHAGMFGLSMITLAGVIFFSLYTLYQEKERREDAIYMQKTSRRTYFLGRFAGSVGVIIVLAFLTGTVTFLLTWSVGRVYAPQLMWAAYWAAWEGALLSAAALLLYALGLGFSTNVIMLLVLYVLGHNVDMLSAAFFGDQSRFTAALSLLWPNLERFNFRVDLIRDLGQPLVPALHGTLYGGCYVIALLTVGMTVLKRHDI